MAELPGLAVTPAWLLRAPRPRRSRHRGRALGPRRVGARRRSRGAPAGRRVARRRSRPGRGRRSTGPGRHPLPSPEAFARTMGAAGIGDDTPVVAYDDVRGSVAARLWWMLDVTGPPRGPPRRRDRGVGRGRASNRARVGPNRRRQSFTPRPWPTDRIVDAGAGSGGARDGPRRAWTSARASGTAARWSPSTRWPGTSPALAVSRGQGNRRDPGSADSWPRPTARAVRGSWASRRVRRRSRHAGRGSRRVAVLRAAGGGPRRCRGSTWVRGRTGSPDPTGRSRPARNPVMPG